MKPGTYEITTAALNGMITVDVTVDEAKIREIRVKKSAETDYIADKPMKDVANAIISGQTLSVDTISGATEATTALLRAVGLAVEKAGGSTSSFIKDQTPIDPTKLPLAPTAESDLVVVGAGGTGLAAAAAAAEKGARVVVLEKMAFAGGSSALAGGAVAAAGTSMQRAAGIEDSPQALAQDWLDAQKRSVKGGDPRYPDAERVRSMAVEMGRTVEWLASSVGVKFAAPRAFGEGGALRAHAPEAAGVPADGRGSTPAGGRFITDALKRYAESKGVEFHFSTPAYELMKDASGRVVGVRAHDGKHRYEFKAKAVAVATGGFARSLEMMVEEVPRWVVFTDRSCAAKGSTGDGIRMAEAAGAAPAADSWMIGLRLAAAYPVLEKAMRGTDRMRDTVLVNEQGKRFVREDLPYLADAVSEQREAWVVMDSSDPKKAAVVADYLNFGIAVDGENWKQLARRMGARAEAFDRTMTAYNADCAAKKDSAFGKDPAAMRPLVKPPFYAVKVMPSAGGTMGGVATNARFEALDAKGQVIPGLYAGGEAANRPYYDRTYVSGTGLGIALTSGRLIGEAAAALR